ncbi:hypothetical protein IVB46_12335 [Bradyrhizobium sp. 61]|uniref:hypothetical protein n=1 Tax=Bradyrhizobium sp. 61 TaxID=2782679 RepID=UPI001FFBE33D|nr:hypothetical protein [Bradyrhizobium sp. 61]MCK1276008.1 hypothetical protein [Bradyrhizobium sp. 61]
MLMSFGMLHRPRAPEFALSGSPITALCKRRRRRIGFVFVVFIVLSCSTGQSYGAENLECPEIGSRSVPDLIGDVSGGGLFSTENRVDLANEITSRSTGCKSLAPLFHGPMCRTP